MVEGIEKDQLLVRFSQVDPFDLNREFSFVIDVSDRIYKGKHDCNDMLRKLTYTSVDNLAASSLTINTG